MPMPENLRYDSEKQSAASRSRWERTRRDPAKMSRHLRATAAGMLRRADEIDAAAYAATSEDGGNDDDE